MKTLFFAVLTMGILLTAVSAEDAPKSEKTASSPGPRKYEPLVMPESRGAATTSVPSQRKEISRETDNEAVPALGPETQPAGRLIVPIEAGKDQDKKQSLWIYTLPEEQAVRRQERMEESRKIEHWEESEKAHQLPEWAIDPEFRKYFLAPDAAQAHPSPTSDARPTDRDLFGLAGKPDHHDLQEPRQSPSDGSAQGIFQNGGSLTLGKEPPTKKETGFSSKLSGEPADVVGKDANLDPLYQSNQKQKRVEDFYDGLNKPVETEQSSDRYHKPQKPQ